LANNTNHRPKLAAQHDQNSLDIELLALRDLSVDELRNAWKASFADVAPSIRSRAILCQLFAWRMQTDAIGGLDSATAGSLTKIGETLQRDGSYEPKIRCGFSTGMVLSREWKGIVHKVTVVPKGFQYLGKRYRSLSNIARTITGTRWSGPRFFGLEQKKAPVSTRAAQ
jgi:hypothetical protein